MRWSVRTMGASALAGHAADYFHRNFSAARSCAEPRLGISQQPLLPGKSVDVARAGVCLRIARPALGRIDRRKRRHLEECAARLRRLVCATGGLCDHEDLFDPGQHRHLLPRLLAVAERQGAGPGSPAGGGAHGIALRGAEVRLYLRPAPAEFRGSVWACLLYTSDAADE